MLGMAALLYLLAAVGGIFLYLYLLHPVVFIHLYFKISVILSGMKLNFTEIDGLTICYGEKGKRRSDKPSMILIHGFTACKFMWAPLVKNLSHDYHVIAVDLPGHGDSDTPSEDDDLSHTETVQKMRKLLRQLKFDETPFHLIGMSMGGALAGLYAAEYPEQIHSLTLICPATGPKEKTIFAFSKIYHNSWVPSQILHGVAEFRKKYYPFYARLFNMLTEPDNHNLLRDCAHRIKAPTQIIWGEQDKVIDASGVQVLQNELPNCVQVDLIPRCGHSMTTDRPGAMTKAILTFKQKLQHTR
ncbi:monoacylglycerol lipase ABHD6-like [Ruditapes philippinarum]|uniref:monoacylglycerol lipase ABHD6-like n=1 Tax=Ruditapes philippinarum TaxID=129788 RepID=UPI00295B5330|nr:monoacylglycerol lipase ABHD6-like [Ruditapes philippinarum]